MRKRKLRVVASALSLGLILSGMGSIPANAGAARPDPTYPLNDPGKDYEMVWQDEFEGDSLNLDDWNVEAHDPGWVNAELQRYISADELETTDNIQVKDGILTIRPTAEKKGAGAEVNILNGTGFDSNWSYYVNSKEGGEGSVSIADGQAVVTVQNVGTANNAVQVMQNNLTLEPGHNYKLSFTASSSDAKAMEISFLNSQNWAWIDGNQAVLAEGENQYEYEFTYGADKEVINTVVVQINFGKINDYPDQSVPATVTMSDVKLIDLTASSAPSSVDILAGNGFDDNWSYYVNTNDGGAGSVSIANGQAAITVQEVGTANNGVQVMQRNLTLKPGHDYKLSFNAVSSVLKATEITFLNNPNNSTWDWIAGTQTVIGTAEEPVEYEFTYGSEKAELSSVVLQLNFGLIKDYPDQSVSATVTLSDVSLIDLTASEASADESFNLKNYDFTSGRINTQNNQTFKYGYFECSARVPKGKGYLPAFWLMANDEQTYGQWPQCGEMDIMEVKGQNTDVSYHTIHYGYNSGNGHKENQGKCKLGEEEDDFYEAYHTFGLEWLPDRMNWFVDGEFVYSTSYWYTGKDEEGMITYPAPFDQEFYVILNLAVGGGWVKNPDQACVEDMDNQQYDIDYVRVYQLPESEYAEMEANAVRPSKSDYERVPDENGNLVVNGQFREAIEEEPEDDDEFVENFVLHLEEDGDGTEVTYFPDPMNPAIRGNFIEITPSAVGELDYSIQLKQEGIPMRKGWEYTLSFEALAEENRSIIVDVEGPDNNWTRYFGDETVNLTTQNQLYTFDFVMEEKTDLNACLEFNLGNQGSSGGVAISNISIKVKQEGPEEVYEKTVRPDGNYVYNGTFDQGERRLGYWEFDEDDAESISVTNNNMVRELCVKVVVPEGASTANPVWISQTELAPMPSGKYLFSFDAYTLDGEPDGMYVIACGEMFTPELTDIPQTFERDLEFDTTIERDQTHVAFAFTKPGTYYLDNVAIRENSIIKNAKFESGLANWETGAYSPGVAEFGVDSIQEGNDTAFDATITTVGTADWNVQLKQRGITLENGKTYKMTFDARASVDRTISVVMQKDGTKHKDAAGNEDWSVYSGKNDVALTTEWQTFEKEFEMTDETDTDALFSVSLGKFDDIESDVAHHVYLDNIDLVEVEKQVEVWPFKDVKQKGWAYPGIKYVYEKGIMTGSDKVDDDGLTTFNPKGNITRGEFITTLYRLDSDAEITIDEMPFIDVSKKKFYYTPILWALNYEITTGTSATTFSPKDNITRQDMAVLLMRFANHMGFDTNGRADIMGMSDYSRVKSYARDAMEWANYEGIITGKDVKGQKLLDPRAFATREECATILMRFMQRYIDVEPE